MLPVSPPRRSRRIERITPFHVMELLARARALEGAGRDIIHMEIGEPDFATAAPVREAGAAALRAGHTGYLPAAGLPELRDAIAQWYEHRFGLRIAAERILLTPGASGALLVALAMLADAGQNVLLPEPGYPCNRNFATLLDVHPRAVPLSPAEGLRVTPAALRSASDAHTAALLLGSPANPTGTMATGEELNGLAATCRALGIGFIVDEIYQGLHYTDAAATGLACGEDVFVVNSFSKYFGMTGWRLGWLVVPPERVGDAEKLIQNLYISAPTVAQYAALACFHSSAGELFESRREAFRERRDRLLPALRELGFGIPATPQGAFYVYVDVAALTADSFAFATAMLEQAGVAATPGLDFESAAPQRHLRFAYTTAIERLDEAVSRIAAFVAGPG